MPKTKNKYQFIQPNAVEQSRLNEILRDSTRQYKIQTRGLFIPDVSISAPPRTTVARA